MKIIYDLDVSNNLVVYIHCVTAGDYCHINDKIHTHSEYNTEWSELLNELQQLEYFKNTNEQTLKSGNDVIVLLTFMNCSEKELLIKKLSIYFETYQISNYVYQVDYKKLTVN